MDVIVQFAVLWGMYIGSALTPTETERAKKMKEYDSEELLEIFKGWEIEYSKSDEEDTVEFFNLMLCTYIDD